MILAAPVAVLVFIASTGVVVSLSRGPKTPPVAVHIPDLAFLVPGVRSFVVWEAKGDARRAVRDNQALLLGYLHHHNVGELSGCVAADYQANVENQALPKWLDYTADGVITVECDGSPNSISFQIPVLECGNPFDVYQVVYGRAFNHEVVRIVRSAARGEP